jgi:hypothetical protein
MRSIRELTIRVLPAALLAVGIALIVLACAASGAAAAPADPAAMVKPAPRSALALKIAAARDAERAAMEALRAKLSAATDQATARAVQKEMEQLKQDGEVQLLRIQAEHHRAAGRRAVAERIEAAIREMTAPPAVLPPLARPAPDGKSH